MHENLITLSTGINIIERNEPNELIRRTVSYSYPHHIDELIIDEVIQVIITTILMR